MNSLRIDSKDGIAAGWTGVRDARAVPEKRRENAAVDQDNTARTTSGWSRTILRFVRNAAIGLALLTAVPIGVVAVKGSNIVKASRDMTVLRERLEDAERFRPLMLPRDASVTPLQAGTALRSLQTPSKYVDASTLIPAKVHDKPWKSVTMPDKLFPNTIPVFNGPSAIWVMPHAIEGFNPEQLAHLRMIAEAPLWEDFDRVGAAGAIDVIGAYYKLPITHDLISSGGPSPRYQDMRELAIAGVSRAAYYLAIGETERAELALRSIVSFGFAIIDNGSSAIDGLVGRVIIGIGTQGLDDYYKALRIANPYGIDFSATESSSGARSTGGETDFGEWRKRLIADAENPATYRGLRHENLRLLSYSSCGNVKEMLLGPGEETANAFERAKRTLARFDSERAYLDAALGATDRIPDWRVGNSLSDIFVTGAATVAGTVLDNPRIAGCTRVVLANQ